MKRNPSDTIYYTTDLNENNRYLEGADIETITYEEALERIEDWNENAGPDALAATLQEVDESDCWLKVEWRGSELDTIRFIDFPTGLNFKDIIVRGPGAHPGNSGMAWISLRIPVFGPVA